MYQIEKKKGVMKWKCDLLLGGGSFKLKATNAWAAYSLKCKIDPGAEPLLRAYAASLSEVYRAHEERLESRGRGPFPVSSEQFLKLVHFLPMIPTSAKYLNLGTFLAKPAAQDFLFLQPLVTCHNPAAAKTAFFSALPSIKGSLVSLASKTALSPAAATKVVEAVASAMDTAASAGGGIK